jgi:Ser/Thr protein kinase RdoA (MazF antagonist)
MLEAPRANDVAVAASYHFQGGLEAPAALIAGYQAVLPMTERELSLVPLLIAARSMLTVAITSWRAKLYPENRAYIQRNLTAAAQTLRRTERRWPQAIGKPDNDFLQTGLLSDE